jgi:hypothetical protein
MTPINRVHFGKIETVTTMATTSTATMMFTRPSLFRSLTALLLCFCLCQQQCLSFQLALRSKTSPPPLPRAVAHHQWLASRSATRQALITLHQAAPLDDEAADIEKEAADLNPPPPNETSTDSLEQPKKKTNVWWKTAALALPLFCKFIIVMVIKFMTDLVVFPLLMLYRFTRLAKRRVLGFFRSKGKDGGNINGSSSL